jgi:hypothetical protein
MSGFEREKRERNERETKQRRNRDARQKQRKSRDRTKKEQRNAAHLLADYQPPNLTPRNGSVEEVSKQSGQIGHLKKGNLFALDFLIYLSSFQMF